MLDFTQRKKRVFVFKMNDNTVLKLEVPNKKIFDKLLLLEKSSNDLNALYEVVRLIINTNRYKKYSYERISELFNFEDIQIFFKEYMNFVMDGTDCPN